MPTDPTPTEPLRLMVQDIADLYRVVTRRVSHESAPTIHSVSAMLRDGIYLNCTMGDYPRAHITAAPGYALEIDTAGSGVQVRAGDDGWAYYGATVDGVPVSWVTRAGTGPTVVGGGQ